MADDPSSTPTADKIQVKTRIPDQFARVLNEIIDYYGPAVGAIGVAVYTVYARFRNYETDECFPSLNTVSKILGLSRPTVIKSNETLAKLGLLKITRRMNADGSPRANLYELLPPTIPVPDDIQKAYFPKDYTPYRPSKSGSKVASPPAPGTPPGVAEGSKQPLPPQESTKRGGSQRGLPPPQGGSKTALPPQSTPLPTVVKDVDTNESNLNETNLTRNDNDEDSVVYDFIESVLERFKTLDPTTTHDEMRGFFEDCLEETDRDMEAAKAYLTEKVGVVLLMKNPEKPKAVLQKAIDKDWKPAAPRKAKDTLDDTAKRRKEAAELERKLEQERKELMKQPAEAIINYFGMIPAEMFEFDRRVKMTRDHFMENPNLEEALKIIREKEAHDGL